MARSFVKDGECPGCLGEGLLLPVVVATGYGTMVLELCLACRLSGDDQWASTYGIKSWEGLQALREQEARDAAWKARRS